MAEKYFFAERFVMCIGASSAPSVAGPRDTSGDPIVSKYDLPPELVEQERKKAAKNKAKSLVKFGGGGRDEPMGGGTTFGGSSYGGYSDAGGGFKV